MNNPSGYNNLSNCNFLGVDYGACSAIIGNTSGSTAIGGVVHLDGYDSTQPVMTIRNTAIVDNHGLWILGVWRGGRYDVEDSLLGGNHVNQPSSGFSPAAVIGIDNQSEAPASNRLAWSTVTGNTNGSAGAAILLHDDSPMNLRG